MKQQKQKHPVQIEDKDLIAYLEGHALAKSKKRAIRRALIIDVELQKRATLIKDSFSFIESEANKILKQSLPAELKELFSSK